MIARSKTWVLRPGSENRKYETESERVVRLENGMKKGSLFRRFSWKGRVKEESDMGSSRRKEAWRKKRMNEVKWKVGLSFWLSASLHIPQLPFSYSISLSPAISLSLSFYIYAVSSWISIIFSLTFFQQLFLSSWTLMQSSCIGYVSKTREECFKYL